MSDKSDSRTAPAKPGQLKKLDGVALLIRDPPKTSVTTLSFTMQNQDKIQNGIRRLYQDKI